MDTHHEITEDRTYVFPSAFLDPKESERLDDLHRGFTTYLGGLLPSKLGLIEVRKVLELGSGSGAWAIQAALEFPSAEVIAVDINPLPNRPLPSNLTFKKANVTEALPFENETFDIVHARLIMMHLPRGHEVFRRCFDLIKPGGWLVVEEPDDGAMADGGKALGPGMTEFVGTWMRTMRSREADPTFGKGMEALVRESGQFDEINIKKVTIPISGKSKDHAENQFGMALKRTIQRLWTNVEEDRLGDLGTDKSAAMKHLEEINDESRSITTDMYFMWSRKRRAE
ncbi:S-adenosyl-L-methionine-dependent methyltransferase [Agrocybe pediades]|nr:S-adenosyl-L-methionine-dependent methyltransferase [Agrocybe pediades]